MGIKSWYITNKHKPQERKFYLKWQEMGAHFGQKTGNAKNKKKNQICYSKGNISVMQKRVTIGGLRLKSLEWPSYKVGPWLVSGNLDFRRVTTIPRTKKSSWLTMSKLFKPHSLFWTPAFLLGIWNFGRQRVSVWPASKKKPWVLNL